ncbi:MAG: histidine kinase, partial [Lachnospiraceae bacterium]|nr:histidine kinase [Lachnospiraceae bacterium]
MEKVRKQLENVLGNDYSKTKLVWMEDTLFGEGEMQLFACRYIRPLNQNHEPGILIVRLRLELIKEEPEIIAEELGSYFILDNDNRICLTYGETEETASEEYGTIVQSVLKDDSAIGKNIINPKNGLVSVYKNTENNFKIIAHVPYHILMRTYYHALTVVILAFIAIMCALFAVSLKISDWLANPIRQINHYMTELSGQRMGSYLSLNTNTELDSIGESYNLMIDRIQKLMEEVKNREEELRKSEMNSLLYQINPHFLYNTLDVIYMLARMHHESEIMQMIEALTKLLRINLSNGADTVSIEEELTYVKAYMDILRVRNDNLFNYEVVCEEQLLNKTVIKLLLQPLVENSIKHGFKHMEKGGKIIVSVSQGEGKIQFLIKNNGELIEA